MGAIADPVVGRIQEGAALDQQVLGGVGSDRRLLGRVLHRALARLRGQDLGPDPRRWMAAVRPPESDRPEESR